MKPVRWIANTPRRVNEPPAGLRWVRGRLGPSRIAAHAIVVFVVSISVHSILAQTPSQPEAPGTEAGR
jgi:hypothetical protein